MTGVRDLDTYEIGGLKFHWLDGGVTNMDGGAMFGVVPKPLWSRKYPVNELNQIELRTEPIFFQAEGKNILIESGIGSGKLSDKQKRNYGVSEESSIKESLKKLSLKPEDIDIILMTHMHFDHASGLTEVRDGIIVPVFENAVIYTSETEWNELKEPNIRSKNTYWKENWEPIQHQVKTFIEKVEIVNGVEMIHTGGHSDGHSIIRLTAGDEEIIHMGDLLPTHAHFNPLWVLAYDDYPMDSIFAKQKWMQADKWYIFYHDAIYRAVKFSADGKVKEALDRTKI
ncbi:hypothetical protein CGZ90_10250 [Fictibacillus aquaticus]|uniref:Metallo-beta-lactamase domain-containing protein n=1 Tax=Fictibacillus aquaticus TaxID=2021314 RepID=A0A235FBF0_9BACL|nr:MBL fold metallo-hydrolase [Fictibacillus aquaticus]OYD58253.1 hypothetical protein CGZ90_10250 [Fictibacillus aquaticus]